MKKRFVVGLEDISKEQEKAFHEYMNSKCLEWWHWINNFWLIVDSRGELTANSLREDLGEFLPETTKFVVEIIGGATWSGFGPKAEKRNMFNWLDNVWTKE